MTNEGDTFRRLQREPFVSVLNKDSWVIINPNTFRPEILFRPYIVEKLAAYGWTYDDFSAEHEKLLIKLGWERKA